MYDYKLDLFNENTSHTKILKLVQKGQDVLEIGCSTGYMTQYLKESLGCKVVCVEIDETSAEKAKSYCNELLIGDIESLVLEKIFKAMRFDVIIIADVIEHLRNPDSLLIELKKLLKDTGYLLLSVPNAAHGAIVLDLLDGKWEYRDGGLLDKTHLHFYDKRSLTALLDKTGYVISMLDRVIIHPRDTEMKIIWENYPPEITKYLEKFNPEYKTYQFIIKSYPASELGWKKKIDDMLDNEKQKNRLLDKNLKELENKMNLLKKQLSDSAKEKKEIHIDLQTRITELEKENAQTHTNYQAKITELEEENAQTHINYQAKITELEKENAQTHINYQAKITEIEKENKDSFQIKLSHLEKHYQTCISELEKKNTESHQLYQEKQQEINNILEELSFFNQEKKKYEELISQQARTLDEIKNSCAWRLITFYRRKIEQWLPVNTRRRQFYHLYVLAPASFFSKIFSILPGKKNKKQDNFQLSISDFKSEWRPLLFKQYEMVKVSIIIPVYNQCDLTFKCLCSVFKYTKIPYEIIIIDNASEDDTAEMLDDMKGIRIIRNQENQGFVAACNHGAESGRGEYFLFLNNDTEVTYGWLEAMLKPFEDEKTGIVGAKLIYPDGRLQEAGNIIWQDGTGWNYGREDNPELPWYSYLREVDYCSGACLMIRKTLWSRLGGFDTRYMPAYYEDTDLCFSARSCGYKVIYQPEARIIHYEGASAGTDINCGYKRYQQINLSKFRQKWQEVLNTHYSDPEKLWLARERGVSKRILVVDHYVPTFDMDSGSLRIFNLLKLMTELGYKIIFWPENMAFHERYTRELQQIGIEVLYDDICFEDYLKDNGQYIDVVFLSRPHIAIHFIESAKKFTNAKIIYDTVDLHFLREERRAKIESEKWKRTELFLAQQADEVLVVSPVEKNILEKEGIKKVSVISNVHSVELSYNAYEKRSGLMFIGGFLHLPNEDGIVWFAESVMPLIQQEIPDIYLYITGSNPTHKVKALSSENITVTGYVEDVSPYFEKTRVFVSPLRYGAGIKGKIGQSMSYGLPVVTTSIGAEGMGLTDGHDVLIADDAQEFADKVIKVYKDKKLWEMLSQNGKRLIERQYSPDAVKVLLESVL